MNSIPLITSDKKIFSRVSKLAKIDNGEVAELILLDNEKKAIEFLNIEMSELVIINFSDEKINAHSLLNSIMNDPWLLHGGIIALCKNFEEIEDIENIHGANIVVVLDNKSLDDYFPKVLSIINNNRRILFQREIGSDIVKNISGSFKLNNDIVEVKCYVNLICNFLYNSNKLDIDKKFNLQLALDEMLLNAIEHGNCKISYNEKSEWLKTDGAISELIKQRMKNPDIAKKKVTFEYNITPNSSKFFIADQGDGFDWRRIKDPTKGKNILELHGRGILITKKVAQNLVYNDKGNEVTFEISYSTETPSIIPGLFKKILSKDIQAGDIIFKQGEPSDFLYYIVKGNYNIIVNEKVVSTLSADDIFMGEMSFLLNNKRSATVQAKSNGKLIKVSKKEFVEAIKNKPHYALFLSRLLAQRIQRLNLMQ